MRLRPSSLGTIPHLLSKPGKTTEKPWWDGRSISTAPALRDQMQFFLKEKTASGGFELTTNSTRAASSNRYTTEAVFIPSFN